MPICTASTDHGERNEIELVTHDNPDRSTVRTLRTDFYEPEARS